jgi:hypothetical protein
MIRWPRLALALVVLSVALTLPLAPPVAATAAFGDFGLQPTLTGAAGPTGHGVINNDIPIPLQPGVHGALISFNLEGLQPNGTYTWRILSGDACGTASGTLLHQGAGLIVADAAGEGAVARFITPVLPYSSVGTSWIAVRVSRQMTISLPNGSSTRLTIPVACGNVGTGVGSSRHWW